jgi:hypothetical protein
VGPSFVGEMSIIIASNLCIMKFERDSTYSLFPKELAAPMEKFRSPPRMKK